MSNQYDKKCFKEQKGEPEPDHPKQKSRKKPPMPDDPIKTVGFVEGREEEFGFPIKEV